MVPMGPDEGGEPSTVEARHVEIEEDEARRQASPEALHGVHAIDGADHGATEFLKTLGEHGSQFGVVIHQQNATLARHEAMVVPASHKRHQEG
jgi:hypothetical protein